MVTLTKFPRESFTLRNKRNQTPKDTTAGRAMNSLADIGKEMIFGRSMGIDDVTLTRDNTRSVAMAADPAQQEAPKKEGTSRTEKD